MEEALKCIVIDDQASVIKGICSTLNWAGMGVQVIATALDGKEGYEAIKAYRPDIVLTDVEMPIMDGIEMIKKLDSEQIQPKYIILSAYGEFEYAKEAMKYNVFDYILKPALPNQIEEVIVKAASQCREDREKIFDEEQLKLQLNTQRALLIENFISMLLEGECTEEELRYELEYLDLDFGMKGCRVFSVQIDDYETFLSNHTEEERQLIKYSLLLLICKKMDIDKRYLRFKKNLAHFILHETDIQEEMLIQRFEMVIHMVQQQYNFSITIGVGEPVATLSQIKESYEQAIEPFKYKMFFGNGKVVFFKDLIYTQMVTPVLEFYDRRKLQDGLKMRSAEIVSQCVDMLFKTIREQQSLSNSYIRALINELLDQTVNIQYQLGEKLPEEWINYMERWKKIESQETLEDLEKLIKDWYQKIYQTMGQKANSRNSRVLEQMLDYVHDHYHEDISLNELSKKIYFTPNYLSALFSKRFNKTFSEYLMEYRMEKAKELLRQNQYKIYEIANMIGYSNLDYFRRVFKNYTGETPSEYANRFQV